MPSNEDSKEIENEEKVVESLEEEDEKVHQYSDEAEESKEEKAEEEGVDEEDEKDKKEAIVDEEDIMKDDDEEEKKEEPKKEEVPQKGPYLFALRTTANREDQVMDFVTSNAAKKKLGVYAVIRPHGMRGYIFMEAETQAEAEAAATGIPYARGILGAPVQYKEIEHMLEQVKKEVDIRKNDIAEIISGPFKREKCKITRVDKTKEEVVVELLESAVPIPITLKMDAIKVIRREGEETPDED
jgi:transcriptional antiterminator NusG